MSIPRFLSRISIVVAAALLVAAAGACSGPSVSVIRQATPNPLIGIKRYALAPVTWDGLTWNKQPEAAWLARRNPEQQVSWAKDKEGVTARMLERFQVEKKDDEQIVAAGGALAPGQFLIAIHVDAYNDGMFSWTFQVKDAAGAVIDEVRGPPRGGGFGIWMELNTLVVFAPSDVLKYLRGRRMGGMP